MYRFIYQYCENVTEKPLQNNGNGQNCEIQFETKSWCPPDLCLQEIAHSLVEKVSLTRHNTDKCYRCSYRLF